MHIFTLSLTDTQSQYHLRVWITNKNNKNKNTSDATIHPFVANPMRFAKSRRVKPANNKTTPTAVENHTTSCAPRRQAEPAILQISPLFNSVQSQILWDFGFLT